MRTSLAAAVLLLALAAPAAATPLAPQTVYATAPKIAGITAAAGWTAWSRQDGSAWQLVLRAPDGSVSAPAVPARAVPFDASLGVRSGGAVVLAYSRCSRDPSYAAGGVVLAWRTARGCVLHLYDVAGGTDRTLHATPGSIADVLPAVSGRLLVHATIARGGKRGAIVSQRLDGGARHTIYSGPADRVRTSAVDATRGPAAVAVHAGRIAFLWNTVQNYPAHEGLPAFGIRLYAVQRDGRPLAVDEEGGATDGACSGYANLTTVTIAGGFAIAEVTTASGWELERAALDQPKRVRTGKTTARIEYAGGVDASADDLGYLPATAVDDSRLVLTSPATGGEQIGESPLPAFTSHATVRDPYQCA